MIKSQRLKLLAALCVAFVSLAATSGCASADKNTAEASELKAKKKKKEELPKNYSLFKKREIRQEYLRRGQKAMVAPALDSY